MKTDEANDSGRVTEESDVSDETNSMGVEHSEHGSHEDEVNMTHSSLAIMRVKRKMRINLLRLKMNHPTSPLLNNRITNSLRH